MVYIPSLTNSNMFRKLLPIRLGRWNRTHAARKAELANHDHCGTCRRVPEAYNNDMDVALCALQSLHVMPRKKKYNKIIHS